MASQIEFKFKYQRKKSAKEEQLDACKERLFKITHWAAMFAITLASFFTGTTQTSVAVWNMTRHCDDERFNQILNPISKTWAILIILTMISALVIMMSVKPMLIGKTSPGLMNILNFFVGFILSWDIVYILQNLISYPIPSYYQNEELKWHYCCKNCPHQKYTPRLENLDLVSRNSFPSFLMCAFSYSTTFLFIFTSYVDEGKYFAAKLMTLMVPGFIGVFYGWILWQHNENHLADVVAGSLLGIFLATYIARDLFMRDHYLDKFFNDFVSVLLARELEMAQLNSANLNSERRYGNEYTINLYTQDLGSFLPLSVSEERPPPYSSL